MYGSSTEAHQMYLEGDLPPASYQPRVQQQQQQQYSRTPVQATAARQSAVDTVRSVPTPRAEFPKPTPRTDVAQRPVSIPQSQSEPVVQHNASTFDSNLDDSAMAALINDTGFDDMDFGGEIPDIPMDAAPTVPQPQPAARVKFGVTNQMEADADGQSQ